ncbi:MAG: putative baseplate assembly protein [Desulfotomaculaceae bacterium]|nr:putative baseplate assembly protein [Desulfotomaculaceae bacterium]
MTLPAANLDDQNFAQLVADAKKLIPRLAPEWTDHNTHDPGITMIELFSWLAETQEYYLNRTRQEHYLKFLKLLGVRPKQAAPAVADVTFSFARQPGLDLVVPKGTRLLADQLIFETREPLTVVPAQIEKIISFAPAGWTDQTGANNQPGLSYLAFGQRAEQGSALYLGFSEDRPFPARRPVSLTCSVFAESGEARGSRRKVPSGIIEWEYFKKGRQNTPGAWAPLKIIKDETGMLYNSGRIYFLAPGDMAARQINPFPASCCWIRATVRQAGFEQPPRLNRVMLNTVAAVQQETFSEVLTFTRTGCCKKYSFAATSLALSGSNYVQALDDNGLWYDWPDCRIEKKATEHVITVIFTDHGPDQVPRRGRKNMRLISYQPQWAVQGLIGRSSGLPHQRFTVPAVPVVARNTILQVGRELPDGPGQLCWEDWLAVADFDASGPGDKHFILDPEQGQIIFGDGSNGAIPPAPANQELLNIRLVSYCAGGGEAGNVLPGAVNKIAGPPGVAGRLQVENGQQAAGGAAAESLEEAQIRARRNWRQGFRAVTSQDYERLACATPGVRVARAKAIPLYQSGPAGAPGEPVPAAVTVVVAPFSDTRKPLPSSGFISNVRRHLDRHRLITTELEVRPPDYVEVRVSAGVVSRPEANAGQLLIKVKEALAAFLHPLTGGPAGSGWQFGRSIYKSEIFELLEKIAGVDYVQEVVLNAQGDGIKPDGQGNYAIPLQSLVYSGEHEVEIIAPGQACSRKGEI